MPNASKTTKYRHVIGCMTGTSLDGLDVVLTRIEGDGLGMKATYVDRGSMELPADLRGMLFSFSQGRAHSPIDIMRAARYLGVVHAEACAQLAAQHPQIKIDFVTAHGQTIWHAPDDRLSWQLFDPWPIVRSLGLGVCSDLRQADLVAGGEGAPITPMSDWVMFREQADVVINLGGIANVTLLHRDVNKVAGFDQGPCNLLLDGLCKSLYEERFDLDGRHAEKGRLEPELLPVFRKAIAEARREGSQGREQYTPAWIDGLARDATKVATAHDILHTAVQFVALQLSNTVASKTNKRWVLAGGGARNPVLVAAIRKAASPAQVEICDDLKIPCEAREGMGFAVLGALSQDRVPISLPAVTGANSPGIAGVWAYPPQ